LQVTQQIIPAGAVQDATSTSGGFVHRTLTGDTLGDHILSGDTLNLGDQLKPGDAVLSNNKAAMLVFQTDANLVLYRVDAGGGTHAIWASNTNAAPGNVQFQKGDGNFVLYDVQGHALWASNTVNRGHILRVQDDCNAVIYDEFGNAVWAANSGSSC
jgi:hypothetical protein